MRCIADRGYVTACGFWVLLHSEYGELYISMCPLFAAGDGIVVCCV